MAFASLRTGAGNRAVCYRHYAMLDGAPIESDHA